MTGVEAPRKRLRDIVPVLPGVLVALLPRIGCPACWPVFAAILSALGLGFLIDNTSYLLPLTVTLLGVALLALAYAGAKGRRGGYWPPALGCAAATAVVFGKFWLESGASTYAGAGVLFVSSLWSAGGRARRPSQAACSCK